MSRVSVPFAAGFLLGVLLALLLTSNVTSRQASAPRPSPSEFRQLDATATTGAPTIESGRVQTPVWLREARDEAHQDRPQPSHPAVAASPTPRPEAEPAPLESLRAGGRPALSTPGASPTKRPRATTRPADGLRGVATWFAAPDGTAAAGPVLRAALGRGWRGDSVRVCSGGECVTVRLMDWCACGDRHGVPTLVDLGADSFLRLAPLDAGVIEVVIR